MTSKFPQGNFSEEKSPLNPPHDRDLRDIASNLTQRLERDALVDKITHDLRKELQVDRVVLYYFYRQWKGQVTLEALSAPEFSILGSTGPDECFNGEYAALYEAGRVRAIEDIETATIAECHRAFLRQLRIAANLVVPILTDRGLWGLLIAHHCQSPRPWLPSEIAAMQAGAQTLATAPSIQQGW